MSLVINLKKEITYFAQENGSYCGPASAQMILRYFQLDDPINPHGQAQLAGFQSKPPAVDPGVWQKFVTDPFEMLKMLAAYEQTDITKRHFDGKPVKQERTAFRDKLRTIAKNESDDSVVVIPVHDSGHWVLLSEYAENTVPDGVTYSSFIGKDPLLYDRVDKGNLGPISITEAGTINIADIQENFYPQTNFLLIGRNGEVTDPVIVIGRRRSPTAPSSPNPAPKPIPRSVAPKLMMQRLAEYGINPCLTGRYLRGMQAGPALLVKRLDFPAGDRDYYLIPLQDETSKENRMLTRMDVRTGYYLDSLTIPPTAYLVNREKNDPSLVTFVKGLVAKYFPAPPAPQLFDAIDLTLNNQNKALVWLPCEQSESAFYPFYEFQYQGKKLYVRIDGQVFDHLTPTLITT